jgi:hypothetical protein
VSPLPLLRQVLDPQVLDADRVVGSNHTTGGLVVEVGSPVGDAGRYTRLSPLRFCPVLRTVVLPGRVALACGQRLGRSTLERGPLGGMGRQAATGCLQFLIVGWSPLTTCCLSRCIQRSVLVDVTGRSLGYEPGETDFHEAPSRRGEVEPPCELRAYLASE